MICQGLTKQGNICSKKALINEKYCGIHLNSIKIIEKKDKEKNETFIKKEANKCESVKLKQTINNFFQSYIDDFENLKDFNTISCEEMNEFINKHKDLIHLKTSIYLINVEENPSSALKSKIAAYAISEIVYKNIK